MPTFVAVESMTVTHVAYVLLLVGSALLSGGLGAYALFVAREDPANRRLLSLFALFMFGATLWSFGDAVQLLILDVQTKVALETVLNVVTVVPTVAWLLFALSYAGRDRWLHRRVHTLLAIEPVLLAAVSMTTDAHDLLWSGRELTRTAGDIPVLVSGLGPAYIAHVLYSYALVLLGAYVLLFRARKQDTTFRGQATLLTIGALVPLVTNVAHFVGLGPDLNFTGAAFTASGLAFWLAITRYRLLDVVPVARESVIDEMRDGYVVVDGNDRVVDANPAAERLLSSSLLVGEPIAAVLPPDADLLVDASEGERTEFVVGEGPNRRFVDADVSSVGRGDASRLLVLRDVTNARETEQRFQTLIENSSDIVTVLDADGTIQYQSPSTERILGYEPEELAGTNAFDLIHPEDREPLAEEFFEGVDEDGYVARAEYRIRHADGSWRVHESVGRNLLGDPAVGGIVINTRDVTERNERERELTETNERLDRFASVVSHDLRNPLNVAQGYVELLEDSVEDETLRGYLTEVETSHDRIGRIVDDVLALARHGGELSETMSVELESVARIAWSSVDTDDASLDVVDSTPVDADRDQFARLLENLFRNAIEHGSGTDGGSAGNRLTVTVGILTDRQGFYVADDGPGLPADLRDRAFQPGVTSQEGGTGLGLAIVADIAEAHGWTVELADEGGGARFDFVIAER
ncbi:histidine kinase N-terminal 7TM domain-containing protein [Haloarchaeobius iranensis]|uniref:histidine kinase N-terminal 7TM domain-containing protein n=1 Tax=Haloarchaeobius iranensis TaxID=996166 RepID=UPI0015874E5A|nr:histidine kinase N-terminal 7TM domain-containing protein [Haloarchaeobius iranensis]